MTLNEITPLEAAALLEHGALLVDIREFSEHQAGIIPAAVPVPLSVLKHATLPHRRRQPVIFHCRRGQRTRLHAAALKAKASAGDAYLLRGGIEAWIEAGLPISR